MRELRSNLEPEAKPAPATHSGEIGWLPEFVYTGEKFEAGLAFFADGLGRITRFSREPADLAAARRLPGQAALPGLINVHAVSWHRLLRGRTEKPSRDPRNPRAPWQDAVSALAVKLTAQDVYEAARMAFVEMLLAGTTCVGEFHDLQCRPDDEPLPDPGLAAEQVLRAAHDVGIRVSLFNVANLQRGSASSPAAGAIDAFVRDTEQMRTAIANRYPADEAWLGVATAGTSALSLDGFKVLTAYAHAQRLRVQVPLAVDAADVAAFRDQHGGSAVKVLCDHGIIDKRFTAIHGAALTDEDCRLLGAARAIVGACPTDELAFALGSAPVESLLSANAAVALGSGSHAVDLLRAGRDLEYALRRATGKCPALSSEIAKALLHAATVVGARSVGSTGGALEVGRPADFFTVNIYEPSIAGADADTLLAAIVFALERRAIREVWIGARQRIVNGRHADQGMIVGRFVELQRRLWGA